MVDSSKKDKVVIGLHNLECVGGVREARYRDLQKYDGIHLLGPSGGKAYTISVLDILKNCGITDEKEYIKTGEEYFAKQTQFQYQSRRRYRARTKPSIQRFNSDADNDRDIRPKRFKSDADNDRDIRPQRYISEYQTLRYTVQTSNRYEHLNY